MDIGWETNRRLQTQLDFRPSLVDWLRTDFSITTNYGSNRNASFVRRTISGADTVPELQRNVTGRRDTRATFTFDPRSLMDQVFGRDEGQDERFMTRSARALGNWVSPVTVTIRRISGNGVSTHRAGPGLVCRRVRVAHSDLALASIGREHADGE